MSKNLALFDFDGTLTKKDTFLEYLKFAFGKSAFITGFLLHSPFLVAMKFKLYPNWKAKEKILTHFFKGRPVQELDQAAIKFTEEAIPQLMRKSGLQQLEAHLAAGDRVYIVSASASLWVKAWCKKMGIDLISTELEIENDYFTGKIKGFNCYGPEKVRRVKALESLNDYDHIYAYGDSSGDKEMLAIADKPHYQYFNE